MTLPFPKIANPPHSKAGFVQANLSTCHQTAILQHQTQFSLYTSVTTWSLLFCLLVINTTLGTKMQEDHSLAQLSAAIFCSFQGQRAFPLLPCNPCGNRSQDYMTKMSRIYLTMSTISYACLSRISVGLRSILACLLTLLIGFQWARGDPAHGFSHRHSQQRSGIRS